MATLDVGNASSGSGSAPSGVTLTPEQESLLRRDYILLNRQSNNGETLRDRIGTAASWNTHGGFINRASSITKVGNDFLVTNYYDKPLLMTPSEFGLWSVKKEYPIAYQSPSATNTGVAYTRGGALDVANDRLVLTSWARHCVRQYDQAGNLQFTIGTPATAGNLDDGNLYYPANAFYTPAGELAVVCYYGKGAGCNNHGHISLFDATDGSFIATRAGCTETVGTQVETGGLYRPIDAVADGNLLYVSVYGRGKIAVLDMSTTNADGFWPVVDIILLPAGAMYASSNSTASELWGVALLSDGNLVINSRRNNEVYCINPATHEHVWTLDLMAEGYQGDNYRITEVSPGYLALTAWGTSQIQIVPTPAAASEQYEVPAIPAGWEVHHAPDGFNVSTGVLSLSNPRERAPEKIAIAIRES